MKVLLTLLAVLTALLLVLTGVGFLLPRTYRVQRSITIHAPAETVYTQAGDLRRWKEWGVWYQRDPQMTIQYSEKTDVLGGWTEWESKGEKGKMTLVQLQRPTQVGYRLEFPDMKRTSNGLVELVPTDGGVNVTLSDDGDLGFNPINRWVGLFLDKWIGPDFEISLENLKKLNEKGS